MDQNTLKPPPEDMPIIRIHDIAFAVKRRWMLGVGIFVLGVAATILFNALSPVLYRGTASVVIESASRSGMPSQDATKALRILSESRPVILRALEQSGLSSEEKTALLKSDTMPPHNFEARIEGQLLCLEVLDLSPKRAAALANAWAAAFVEKMTQQAKASGMYAKAAQDKSLPELRNDWAKKLDALGKFEQEARFDPKSYERNPVRKRVDDLSNKVTALGIALAGLEAEHEVPARPVAESDSAKTANPETREPRTAAQINSELSRMKAERQKLESQLASANQEFEELKSKASRHRMLSSEVSAAERLYLEVAQKKNAGGPAEIAELAFPWEKAEEKAVPSRPRWFLNLAVGTLLASILALAGMLVAERLDARIFTSDDLERRLRGSVVGSVPTFSNGQGAREACTLSSRDPDGAIAHSLRTIAGRIEASRVSQGSLVLVVTSPAPGEGKSFLAANLATSFLEWGRRVLLVDGDLCINGLSRTYDQKESPGLSELLDGASWTPEFVQKDVVSTLSFLPAGRLDARRHPGIRSERVRPAIDAMKRDFDIIIFDTPPLLAAADALIFGKFSDLTLVAARSRKTRWTQVERATALLHSADVKNVVFVVNAVAGADADCAAYCCTQADVSEKGVGAKQGAGEIQTGVLVRATALPDAPPVNG